MQGAARRRDGDLSGWSSAPQLRGRVCGVAAARTNAVAHIYIYNKTPHRCLRQAQHEERDWHITKQGWRAGGACGCVCACGLGWISGRWRTACRRTHTRGGRVLFARRHNSQRSSTSRAQVWSGGVCLEAPPSGSEATRGGSHMCHHATLQRTGVPTPAGPRRAPAGVCGVGFWGRESDGNTKSVLRGSKRRARVPSAGGVSLCVCVCGDVACESLPASLLHVGAGGSHRGPRHTCNSSEVPHQQRGSRRQRTAGHTGTRAQHTWRQQAGKQRVKRNKVSKANRRQVLRRAAKRYMSMSCRAHTCRRAVCTPTPGEGRGGKERGGEGRGREPTLTFPAICPLSLGTLITFSALNTRYWFLCFAGEEAGVQKDQVTHSK